MDRPIKLFIKDISDLKEDANLKITDRCLIKDKVLHYQINCHSIEKLIELLRYNSEYITEWYDDEYKCTNDQFELSEILLSIIENFDLEIFKAFTNIFQNTLPYVNLNAPDNDIRGASIFDLIETMLNSKDKGIYIYYIKHLAFKTYHDIFEIFSILVSYNQQDGFNDEYYDYQIELLRFIESEFTKEDIIDLLSDYLDGLQDEILANNYKCANLILEYIHKYYPSKPLPYGLSIVYAIGHNRLDFYDLFMQWYNKDLVKFKSEEIMETIPGKLYDSEEVEIYRILFKPKDTNLESLQFFHSKVMSEEFYSESAIQCLIVSSMEIKNKEGFIYLINAFPYEAMMLVNSDKWIEFEIDTYKPHYRKLLKLKKAFYKYTKKKKNQ